MEQRRPQYGLFGRIFPPLLSRFGIKAIDVTIGRTHHHIIFPYRRGGIYLAAGLECPYLATRVERVYLACGIRGNHQLLISRQPGTDIAIILKRPYFAYTGVLRIDVIPGAIIIPVFRCKIMVNQRNRCPSGLGSHPRITLLIRRPAIADGNDVIAAHGVFGPQVGASHDAGDALKVVLLILVTVTAEKELHIAGFYPVDRLEPVV